MVVDTAFISIGHKSAEAGRSFSSVLLAYVLPRLSIRMAASQHIWMRSDGRGRREHDILEGGRLVKVEGPRHSE